MFCYNCQSAQRMRDNGLSIPWWGARALFEGTAFNLLYDRQSCCGEDTPGKLEFFKQLNRTALPAARRKFKELVRKGQVTQSSNDELLLYDEDIRILANPNGSYGYLYIFAYRPQDLETAMKEKEATSAS